MARPPAAIGRLGCAFDPAKLGMFTMANLQQTALGRVLNSSGHFVAGWTPAA
jgi:hypothetical protein